MPKVSVIIPSYNHEKYVAEAIQSVLDQTFQDFEIVITDDGSTDKTVEEIKKFKDPRIRLFCFNENQGAAVAANKCISESSGEFIAILSSDDIFFPEKLEKQVRFLDNNFDVGAVLGYAQIVDKEGEDLSDDKNYYCHIFRQENKTRHQWLNHFFYKGNCLCHPSAMIRKKCYDEIGHYDERLEQLPDFDLWMRLCLCYEIYIMPEILIKFRFISGGGNTSSGDDPHKRIRSRVENALILKNYLDIKNGEEFLKIFPQDFDYLVDKGEVDPDLIAFYASYLSLKTNSPMHEFFGIHAIFELLRNDDVAIKIKNKTGFAYKDLIKLTGQHDLFSSEAIAEKEQMIQELKKLQKQ